MNQEELQNLGNHLRKTYGSVSRVARDRWVTPSYVTKVLSGARKSQFVLTVACKVLEAIEKEQADMRRTQQELLEKARAHMTATA